MFVLTYVDDDIVQLVAASADKAKVESLLEECDKTFEETRVTYRNDSVRYQRAVEEARKVVRDYIFSLPDEAFIWKGLPDKEDEDFYREELNGLRQDISDCYLWDFIIGERTQEGHWAYNKAPLHELLASPYLVKLLTKFPQYEDYLTPLPKYCFDRRYLRIEEVEVL